MIVKVSSRHLDVTEPLKAYAQTKAARLVKYFDRIEAIDVIFDAGRGLTGVEMIVSADHKDRFVAHHKQSDVYACVDECMAKLERQLRDHKQKLRNRKHAVGDKRSMPAAKRVSRRAKDL